MIGVEGRRERNSLATAARFTAGKKVAAGGAFFRAKVVCASGHERSIARRFHLGGRLLGNARNPVLQRGRPIYPTSDAEALEGLTLRKMEGIIPAL